MCRHYPNCLFVLPFGQQKGFIMPSNAYPRFDLPDQVVLITGAARGIGQATALACAHAGAHIALGLRDVKSAGELVQQIKSLGRKVLPLQMDVTKVDQIQSAIQQAASHFGRLDVLVNNAGAGRAADAIDVPEKDFDEILTLNLKSTFFASQAAAKIMIPQKSGRIVNLSSQAGFVALPKSSVYCTTKAAISHLTKCLACEWGPHNITVNAVAPTFIRTPGTQGALTNPESRAHILSMIKLGHPGEPMDVAAAIIFLASPAASMITGTTLLVDGGWTAH
jgi:NAD(P)-dependent dehydrogenase (short-subunit alcohol dehydrogenase family)